MTEFVAAQASVLMVPTLGKGGNSFQSKLNASLATVRGKVEIPVEAKTAQMVADVKAAKEALERDAINLRVNVDDRGWSQTITRIRNDEGRLAKMKKALTWSVVITGLPLIAQLGSAVAAVNADVVALSQSLLLLPGILSGLAASLGTAILGTRGLSDAFKAFTKAQDDSVDAGRKQRNAAKDVTRAQKDLARATKDAKRELEDLHAQMRDAPLDEADAIIAVQEARTEAAQRFGKDALEQQKDMLALQKAEADLMETRRMNVRLAEDYREAAAKGITDADGVTAAQERLNDALEDQSKGVDSINDLAKAMAKLSPAGQDFVTKITGLKGAWDQLRSVVQERLFAGLGDDVVKLAGVSLPMLETGLGRVADGLNNILSSMMTNLGDAENQGFLERILGNTGDANDRFARALDPFIDSFLHLSAVGSDLLPRLATGFETVMQRFESFLNRADENGDLDKWIENGIQAFKDLGNSLINIGDIMNSVREIFVGTGGRGMLDMLASGTEKLATFLNSTDGQTKLADFFYDMRAELDKFTPLLESLPGLVENIMNSVQAWSAVFLPFLTTAADLLENNQWLVDALMFAFVAWKVIPGILAAVSGAMVALNGAMLMGSNLMGGQAARTGLNGKMGAFAALMSPGGAVVAGVTAVALILANQYATAQQEAAEQTQHHKDTVDSLKRSIDDLSGVITKTGIINQLNELGGWSNNNLEDSSPMNIPEMAQGLGHTRTDVANAISDPAAFQQFTSENLAIVEEELRKGAFWQEFGPKLEEQGYTSGELARAISGDTTAFARFDEFLGSGTYGYTPTDIVQGQHYFGQTQLEGLSQRGQDATNVNRAVTERFQAGQQTGQQQVLNNEAVVGRAAPIQGTALSPLNPISAYYDPSTAGAAEVRVSMDLAQIQRDFPDLFESIGANGGTFTELAPGQGTMIHLQPDRAPLYVEDAPGFSAGGFLRGRGSGTSDSMLARVSNGEFITKASVVGRNPALYEALNSGALDPASFPAFAPGGLIGNLPTTWIPDVGVDGAGGSSPGFGVNLGSRPLGVGTAPGPEVPAAGTPDGTTSVHAGTGVALGPGSTVGSVLNGTNPLLNPRPFGVPTGLNAQVPTPLINTEQGTGGLFGGLFGGLGGKSGLPDSLNPATILQNVGQILLDAVLGFFGIDSYYLDVLKSGLGELFGGKDKDGNSNDPANSGAQMLMDGWQNANSAYPLTSSAAEMGFSLSPNTNSTDYIGGMSQVASAFGLQLTSGARDEAGSLHSTGMAGDFSNGTANTDEMLRFANFIADNYPEYTKELIYDDPRFTRTIKDGQTVGPFGQFYTMAQAGNHQNHVHWATSIPPAAQQAIMDEFAGQQTTNPVAGFNRQGGVEQYRPYIQQALQNVGAQYGITNMRAWEDDIMGQIQFESRGDYGAINPQDSDGQRAVGLGQFKDGTFASNNVTGGDIMDPIAQIYAMINYMSGRYGAIPDGGVNWGDNAGWRNGLGYASGGLFSGPGSGTSDSILARVSNGEFITRASVVAKNPGLFHALNQGQIDPASLPGFAEGTPPNSGYKTLGIKTGANATQSDAQLPSATVAQPAPVVDNTMSTMADAFSGLGGAISGGASKASGAPVETPKNNPRAILGAPPVNEDHNNPGLSAGIEGAFSHIGSLAATAASAASSAGTMGAGGAGGSAAGSLIQGGAQLAGQVATGALNVLSSLLVGTAPGSTGTTAGAYGTPVLPQGPPQSQQGGRPGVVNNYGDIHTANYDEFYKGQQRREAQQQAPILPMR